ncbi:MAG: Mth938-like domain-containing protein [Hyphomicrobium sp.]
MKGGAPHYPRAAPISAYGAGGFRFAEMSHRGSIMCLPSGVYAWDVARVEDVLVADFERPLAELTAPGVLLFGTGARQVWPDEAIMRAFATAGLGLEIMSTGAAARTYNVLLAEGRSVGAALIAVD